jgi:hypothetical protein
VCVIITIIITTTHRHHHHHHQIGLIDVDAVFGARTCPWNRNHGAARSIFNNPLALQTVRAQHASL